MENEVSPNFPWLSSQLSSYNDGRQKPRLGQRPEHFLIAKALSLGASVENKEK